jgi:TDG/mug DNA glycosylase family protein
VPPSVTGFTALGRPDARVLILGSMPGVASLTEGRYYAHPRNVFWAIMDELMAPVDCEEFRYQDRVSRLLRARIALWDVLKSCQRAGSLDSSIKRGTEVANDFESFYCEHPEIALVVFNGTKAQQSYARLGVSGPAAMDFVRMPSTSPAHASLGFEEKLECWRTVLAEHLP